MRERSVQVDIETKGTNKDSFVLSIGAVGFDDDGFLNTYEKTRPEVFYGQVPWNDITQLERVVDPGTLDWWTQQGPALQCLQSPDERQRQWCYPGLQEALESFNTFVTEQKTQGGRIICKGVDFDVAILSQAMAFFGITPAWKYNHTRCMRGWLDACYAVGLSQYLANGIAGGNPGIKHHAADDAIWQTMVYVRYNHELWKIRHKGAQQTLFTEADGRPIAPTKDRTRKSYTSASSGGMLPAPTLQDAP